MKKKFFMLVLPILAMSIFAGCSKDDDKDSNTNKEQTSDNNKDQGSASDTEENKTIQLTVSGTIANHDYVDLGLPSGTKWATHNVGAKTALEYGSFFAWGETEEKESYSWENYKWGNGDNNALTKYSKETFGAVDNKNVLDAEDDAAIAHWGTEWRTPTKEELEELFNGCTWTNAENLNGSGTSGLIGTSKTNGSIIFLPCSGLFSTEITLRGNVGNYFSSNLSSRVFYVEALTVNNRGINRSGLNNIVRQVGASIRAVVAQ